MTITSLTFSETIGHNVYDEFFIDVYKTHIYEFDIKIMIDVALGRNIRSAFVDN